MNRKAFDRLNIQKQVEHINSLLKQGHSVNHICKKILHIPTSTLRDRFKTHQYQYDKQNHSYVKDTKYIDNSCVTRSQHFNNNSIIDKELKEVSPVTQKQEKKGDECNTSITQIKKETSYNSNTSVTKALETNDLQEFLGLKDRVIDMLKWFEQERNVIDINQLHIEKFEGETVSRSFKVDKDVLEEFVKYCKEHKQYTQRDIISFALKYLMDNFK